MLQESRERWKQTRLHKNPLLVGLLTQHLLTKWLKHESELPVRIVVMTVWVGRVGLILIVGKWKWRRHAMGGWYLMMITYHILFDDLCFKIASKNRVLVLLVVCGIERHAQHVNQSTSLTSKPSSKIEANSTSQRRTQLLRWYNMTHLDFEQLPTLNIFQ